LWCKPSKISPLQCPVEFFLRYRLSGNSHPGSPSQLAKIDSARDFLCTVSD
jgi:hypothetical protein